MANPFGTTFLLGQGNGTDHEVMRKCHFYADIVGLNVLLAVQEVNVPRYELEPVDVFFYNDRVKVASKPNAGEWTLSLLDYVSPSVVDGFWTWFKQIYDPSTRNMGYASDYKRQGFLYLMDPAGAQVRTWTMKGIWPMNAPAPSDSYSYEAGQEVVKLEVKLSVDVCTLDGGGQASVGTA